MATQVFAVLLYVHFMVMVISGTKRAYMKLGCDGKGYLVFGGNNAQITAMRGFNYKTDISLNEHNAHKTKHSKLYNVDMQYAVGPIAPNVYIHSGNIMKSLGCPHLMREDAMKFYKFVKESDKVQLITTMAYEDHSTLCDVTHFLQNLFTFRWYRFAKETTYGDTLGGENTELEEVDSAQSVMYDNDISMDHMKTENYEQTSPLMFMVDVITVASLCSLMGAIVGIAFGCVSKVNS